MEGFVTLSQENGNDLVSRCLHQLTTYKPITVTTTRVKFFTRKRYDVKMLSNDTPNWWYYREVLTTYLNDLQAMLDRKDDIQLSLTCYNELIKLSKGDKRVNEIFILNY